MRFITQKKGVSRSSENEGENEKKSKKWWSKSSRRPDLEPEPEARNSIRFALPENERSREDGQTRAFMAHGTTPQQDSPSLSRASSLSSTDAQYLAAQASTPRSATPDYSAYASAFEPNYQAQHQPQPQPPRERPSSSRSSNYATSGRTQRPPQTQPEPPIFDRTAFAGAFEPVREGRRQSRYRVPPLTVGQLNELAGVFRPDAPPPQPQPLRREVEGKMGYR